MMMVLGFIGTARAAYDTDSLLAITPMGQNYAPRKDVWGVGETVCYLAGCACCIEPADTDAHHFAYFSLADSDDRIVDECLSDEGKQRDVYEYETFHWLSDTHTTETLSASCTGDESNSRQFWVVSVNDVIVTGATYNEADGWYYATVDEDEEVDLYAELTPSVSLADMRSDFMQWYGGYGGETQLHRKVSRANAGQYSVDARAGITTNHKSVTIVVWKADIKQGGGVITGTTHNEIIGQSITLTAATTPTGVPISSVSWNIPGTRIYNWTADTNASTYTALDDLTVNPITFHWVGTAGTHTVSCGVSAPGGQSNPSATFSIKRPTADITATTGSVLVTSAWGGLYLRFGTPTTPGISFSRTITSPPGFATGSTQWVQTYNAFRRRRLDPEGTWEQWAGAGLDQTYPYSSDASTCDSPGTALTSNSDMKTVQDTAEMWLMFKPSDNGIWVPLRKVNWDWAGSASKGPLGWSLDASINTSDPTDYETTDYPAWVRNVASNQWLAEE
jgi:hypothetical protein